MKNDHDDTIAQTAAQLVVQEDVAFLVERYFHEKVFSPGPVRQKEHFVQHKEIVNLFGYSRWSEDKE